MIAADRLLVLLFVVPSVLALSLYVSDLALGPMLAIDGLLLAFAAVDAFSLPGPKRLRASRECLNVCSLGERHPVALIVENRSRRSLSAEVRDDLAPGLEGEPSQIPLVLPPRSRARVVYTLVPLRRGTFELGCVYARVFSRWGLFRRYYRLEAAAQLRVYPALRHIRRYATYARMNRLQLIGVRRSRRIGTDNEFERLREYNEDDQFKAIDWRATARRRRLMVRDFQSNHNQRIVFLVDCGRMTTAESNGLSMLDHALDAVLTLSHVALGYQDQVGLLAFSNRVLRWIKPAGGRRQTNRLVHAVHDIHPQIVESRYDLAFLHLERHCRKRTLAVLVTNLIDDVNAAAVHAHLTNLVGRHLPLGVFLRDHELFDVAERGLQALHTGGGTMDRAGARARYRGAAAVDVIESRQAHLVELRRGGALVLDLFPEDFTAGLINEYLRIKARHLL